MGLKISKIEYIEEKEKAYDLSVNSENHTYQLENGVVVHNSLKVPKQYFGFTDDSTGFNGGTALSLASSRYAKTIKRIQNTMIQLVTDAVNLILLDKGLNSYVNKFQLRMQEPTTQEEKDRRENLSTKIQVASDIMNLLSDIEEPESRLKILKALLASTISDPDVISILSEQIDKLDAEKNPESEDEDLDDYDLDDDFDMDSSSSPGIVEPSGSDSFDDSPMPMNEPPSSPSERIELPTPAELGVGDMTQNI